MDEKCSAESAANKDKGIFDDFGKAQALMSLFEEVTTADFDHDGVPDIMELQKIAVEAFQLEEKFRASVSTMKVLDVVAALEQLKTDLSGLISKAQSIVGPDIAAFKAQFPNVFKSA